MGKGIECLKRVCLKRLGSYGYYMGVLGGYTISKDSFHIDFLIFPNLIAINTFTNCSVLF